MRWYANVPESWFLVLIVLLSARLQVVLVRGADDRNLVVVAASWRSSAAGRSGAEPGLRADAVLRDDVAGERRARCVGSISCTGWPRVDVCEKSPVRSASGRHQRGLRGGVAVRASTGS